MEGIKEKTLKFPILEVLIDGFIKHRNYNGRTFFFGTFGLLANEITLCDTFIANRAQNLLFSLVAIIVIILVIYVPRATKASV